MPRKVFTQETFQGNARITKGFSVGQYMAKGAVPPELLGLGGQGGFSGIAHSGETLKRLDNLVNSGVDDEIIMSFATRDEKGNIVPKTTPFMWEGKQMRPDANGNVRITDQGKIDLATKISLYRKVRTNKLMGHVRLGDDIASYIFGLPYEHWMALCAKDSKLIPEEMKMHADLAKLECSVEYINSLPPSLTQTQAIAKLRKIVEFYEKNVNIEALSSVPDALSNMKDGHNVYNKLSDNNPYQEEVVRMKARAEADAGFGATQP